MLFLMHQIHFEVKTSFQIQIQIQFENILYKFAEIIELRPYSLTPIFSNQPVKSFCTDNKIKTSPTETSF